MLNMSFLVFNESRGSERAKKKTAFNVSLNTDFLDGSLVNVLCLDLEEG